MPTKDRNAVREEQARMQAVHDLKRIVRMIRRKRLAGRQIEGQNGMAWRLWNPILPDTTLDLYLTRGTIVMRGKLQPENGTLAALQLLGVDTNE